MYLDNVNQSAIMAEFQALMNVHSTLVDAVRTVPTLQQATIVHVSLVTSLVQTLKTVQVSTSSHT